MTDFKEKTVLTLKQMVDNKMVVNLSSWCADKDDFDFDDFLYLIDYKIVNDNFISGKYQLTECGYLTLKETLEETPEETPEEK